MMTRSDWHVEYRESSHLTTIDGFLITYSRRCYLTLKSTLSAIQKEAVAAQLLGQLPMAPSTGQVYLSPDSAARVV